MPLTVIGWLCLAPIAAISAIFVVEMVAGLLPARRMADPGDRPAIAIIIPAHDEAAGISATIAALRKDLPDNARLLVVADNCSDETAGLARAAGVEVIERHDPIHRGKGYALAFGRDHLKAAPPDVAVIIDADCRIAPDGLQKLAAIATHRGAPVQAAYLLAPRPGIGPLVQLSGFAFLVKNLVRQRGLARMGAPALLTGSGMAFPWVIFAAAPLATDDIVEDLSLGVALAERGHPPIFLPDVLLWSTPSSTRGTIDQRRRWEHGFLATARSAAMRLIFSGQWRLAWLGAHLLVPPLALLVILNMILAIALAALLLAGASTAPLMAQVVLIVIMAASIVLAWLRDGRDQIRLSALLLIPFYILWKSPLYLTAFTRRERRWIRTHRDKDAEP
jgi:cellulose synthase/poly-beta-1,6-N-acetylglucosamine synthase-like glycosyltransferase